MTTRELDSIPGALGLYAKAALPLIPLASRLPFVAGSATTIPDRELVVPRVTVDRDKLQAYVRVCGFPPGDVLPVTYPFALAAPLHMALMTEGDFPFPAIGLVHVRNRIDQHRPIGVDEALALRVRAGDLQPHPKGRTFDLTTEFRVGDELVWSCVSTIFRRGGAPKGDAAAPDAAKPADPIDAVEVTPDVPWSVPGDIGRRYGAASGDVNPIHLHPLSAKLLGFPRAIAHGMWSKARALAEIADQLPDAYAVEVRFQRPILLPAEVLFGRTVGDDGRIGFAVQDAQKGTPHLRGLVTPA